MAKKRKPGAKKNPTRKPARKQPGSPDATVNALVVLVVIAIVLGGLYLYAQNNRKQAALLPDALRTIVEFIAPAPPPDPIAQSEPAISAPVALPPLAQSPPVAVTPAEITGTTQSSQTTASAKARHPMVRPAQHAPLIEPHQPATVPIVPSPDH
jgi:hypothetical protein